MKKLLFFSFICLSTGKAFAHDDPAIAFIEKHKQLAIDEMKRTGVPAAITLAQLILETNCGKSILYKKYNNCFGIKWKKDRPGPFTYHNDEKKHEKFRRYYSVSESFKDHSDFLRERSNYAFLFAIDPRDYTGWAKGLKSAGYATNPQYADSLIAIIERYNLCMLGIYESENIYGHWPDAHAFRPILF